MRRYTILPLCLLGAGLAPAPAAAQMPYQYGGGGYQYGGGGGYQYGGYGAGAGPYANPGAFLPNFYNPQNQPLSPYLNLLRGGNTAVNYYYGVRPGTPAGGLMPFGGTSFNPAFTRPMQFLPQAAVVVDPAAEMTIEPGGRETTLRPAGHPVLYGNTFNGHGSYSSVYAGAFNRGAAGLGLGQQRPGGTGQQPGTGQRPGGTGSPGTPPRR